MAVADLNPDLTSDVVRGWLWLRAYLREALLVSSLSYSEMVFTDLISVKFRFDTVWDILNGSIK